MNMHVAGIPGSCVGGEPGMMPICSLVPRPSPSFLSLAVRLCGRGPGTFSHVSDTTGRKTVERLELNVGEHYYNVALCLHCFVLVKLFVRKGWKWLKNEASQCVGCMLAKLPNTNT